jgi:hypothetical protein
MLPLNDNSQVILYSSGHFAPSQRPCTQKIKHIAEIAGKSLIKTSIIGTTLFFSTPVTVPLAAGIAAGIPTFAFISYCTKDADNRLTSPSSAACINGLFCAIIAASLATIAASYHTWNPITHYVYNPYNASLIGTAGTGIFTLGISLRSFSKLF